MSDERVVGRATRRRRGRVGDLLFAQSECAIYHLSTIQHNQKNSKSNTSEYQREEQYFQP